MKNLLKIHRSSGMHWVGDGFAVRSVFDYNGLGQHLSPFLLLDYGAPREFTPTKGRRGVGSHPHRGFETVTIAYQGEVSHRDSSGGGGTIKPGDVQWMTAAGGIVHEEFHSEEFSRKGGVMQMAQLWVNLPARDKMSRPRYQPLTKENIPVANLPEGAGTVRVIAGSFGENVKGPALTFTPINLWDVNLRAGKSAELPFPDGHTSTFLVLKGEIETGGKTASEGDLVIFERAGSDAIVAAKSDAHLLVMDGKPIDEPIVGHGPFVMNTVDEIEQAFMDFHAGKMGVIK
ncbi:MAG: pirin family protein [Planctomycetes bacterium]|nr:pirin family protein [Planctomycetota bacterium]